MAGVERHVSRRWRSFGLAGLIVVLTFLAYQPAWHGAPVFDDADHLTPPELQSLSGLAKIWTQIGVVSQYYPVTHTAFWLQRQLWGDAMLGYHLVNIALHALGALLLVKVLRTLAVPGAWLAAAIFAVHPVHVESVAWISELKNTLSGACYLGAMWAYLKYDATRSRRFYAIALAVFVVALLSKTVTATLPAALLVVFWWKRGRLSWRQDVGPLLPFFACGLCAGLLAAWVEHRFIGARGAEFDLSFVERGLVAGRAFWFYVGKLIWPADLIFIYPRWSVSAATVWQYLFPLALLLAGAGAWRIRERTRAPLVVLLLFFGTLFPALGFFNVYPFLYSFVADHYQYLASIAVIAGLVGAAAHTCARRGRRVQAMGAGAGVVLVGLLAFASWRQSAMYEGPETLWRATLARNPASWVAATNLGNVLLARGEVSEAISWQRRALELRPTLAEARNNLGNALLQKGELDEAEEAYRRAVALRPDFAVAHFNLAALLLRRGRSDAALEHFERAVAERPEYAMARINLGSLYLDRGRVEEAIAHFRAALAVRPDEPEAHVNLGNALLRTGNSEQAMAHYERALAIDRENLAAHYNYGYALLQAGRIDEALVHLRAAVALRADFAPAQYFLGGALLQAGDRRGAIACFERAVAAKPDFAEAHNDLGTAWLQAGEPGRALTHYRAGLALQPENVGILSNLAWLRATTADASLRNGSEAIELAQRAHALVGHEDPVVLQGLAAAYAESGRFAEALDAASAALQHARARQNIALVEQLRAQTELYRAGSPLREAAAAGAAAVEDISVSR